MSSTHRKNEPKNLVDNYPTPHWVVRRFLEYFVPLNSFGPRWIDPAAGDGSIIKVIKNWCFDIKWTAVEIRDTKADLLSLGLDTNSIFIADFFDLDFEHRFDVAIMNPPFSQYFDFICRCREIADWVISFQTVNMLGSTHRHAWIQNDVPDMYVLPDRVSHINKGKTDSVYSAWYVWTPERRTKGNYVILDLTPIEERKFCYSRLEKSLGDF